jgi:hypothetical protein
MDVSVSHSIGLLFRDDVAPVVRRRIAYAFGIFCAVRGVRIVEGGADVLVRYGAPPEAPGEVAVRAAYQPRPPSEPARRPWFIDLEAPEGAPVRMPVFHGDGPPSGTGDVDWLAELFEWLSGADEHAAAGRDDVGRVAFGGSVHGRFGLDPEVPFAAVAVSEFDRLIARSAGDAWTAGEPSPWPDTALGVAVTHDIDFLPDHVGAVGARWLRNVAAGALRMRSATAAARAGLSVLRPLAGRVWLGDALERFRAREAERGVRSTWTVVCRDEHRRDPTYRLRSERTQATLARLASSGAELGVHGSYTSLEAPGRLADEYDRLRAFGHEPVGGRQHWLRYEGDGLFRELVRADALYDATVGFPGTVGFRNGASFPFPPYDFENERAFPLLEIPLAVMDVGLAASTAPGDWLARSRHVLRQASRWTWGGVSVLWHDTSLAGALHPDSLGEVYFDLIAGPGRFTTAKELVETVRERYAVAGFRIGSDGRAR